VKAQDIINRELIGIPKVWKYKDNKVALYFNEIKESDIDMWSVL